VLRRYKNKQQKLRGENAVIKHRERKTAGDDYLYAGKRGGTGGPLK
jgi:hypothetical protein